MMHDNFGIMVLVFLLTKQTVVAMRIIVVAIKLYIRFLMLFNSFVGASCFNLNSL
jgi:hypothetical protein